MPTGFDKFSKKALDEAPITIARRADAKEEKIEQPVQEVPEKETFISVKVKISTKDKLEELKYLYKKNLRCLTEEAIDDLYEKYKSK